MTKTKKTALAFGTACALAFTGGLAALNTLPVNAQTAKAGNYGFYGDQLKDPIALAFYDELVAMTVDPDGDGEELSEFRRGVAHTVTSQAILGEAVNYENGSTTLIKQFGAALDCFRYDQNELFYVDFNALNFTVNKSVEEPEPPAPDGEEQPTAEEGDGSTEEGDGSEGDGSEEEGGSEGEVKVTYSVTIGAGRAASYFLYGLTPEDINGTGETEGLCAKYETAKIALVNKAREAVNGLSTPEEKAAAINKLMVAEFRGLYGYDYDGEGNLNDEDRFVATTNSIVAAKPYANAEGLARVYKMLMEDEDVDVPCVLVSGYRVVGDTVKAGIWNYVQDKNDSAKDNWYAVDVANNFETDSRYVYVSKELFSLDHFEDKVVSLSNHRLHYPDLKTNPYNVETGELQIADGTYEGREGIAVSYTGEGGKLAFRVKDENGAWSAWTTFEDYMKEYGPDAGENTDEGGNEPDAQDDGETPPATGGDTETEPNPDPEQPNPDPEQPDPNPEQPEPTPDPEPTPVPTYKIALSEGIYYLFDLTKGAFQIGVFDENNKCVEYSETVKESLDKLVPVSVTANPEMQTAQDISKPIEVKITYGADLKKIDENADVTIEFSVSSVLGFSVNEEFIKQFCKIEDVSFNADTSTIRFKFTPSAQLAHNGLRYSFTVTNVETETGARPQAYSVVFKLMTELRARGVFGGSNYYTDAVSQPSLVYNNDLSFEGWKYADAKGERNVLDNMRSALALSVMKPFAEKDTAITEAVKAKIGASTELFKANAYLASENYLLDLTLDGKSVTIPQSSYVKLAFPYPEGYGPESENVVYKVLRFPKNGQGDFDYENPEILDAIGLRQGIVTDVNGFAAFALVAIDEGKLVSPVSNSSMRLLYTMTTGVGGTVTTASGKSVNSVNRNGTLSFTLTADEGYKLDSVTLNGVAKAAAPVDGETNVYRISVNYNELVIDSVPSTNNVLNVEFVVATAEEGVTAVMNAAANNFVNKQLSKDPYEDGEREIIKDYPTGGAVYVPVVPPQPEVFDPSSSMMQLIIVLGVVGAFAVIGAIVIIYCAAIRPKIIREREEEAARIAANRERRANRNRMQSMGPMPRDPKNPMGK